MERQAKSAAELAEALGRTGRTVRRWLARPDWPFGPRPPWSIARVRRWTRTLAPDRAAEARAAAETGERPDAKGRLGESAEIRLELQRQRARKIRLEADRLAGQLHDVEECTRERLAKVHAVKRGLLALPKEIAPELLGVADVLEIETRLTVHVRGLLAAFAAGWDGHGPRARAKRSRAKR